MHHDSSLDSCFVKVHEPCTRCAFGFVWRSLAIRSFHDIVSVREVWGKALREVRVHNEVAGKVCSGSAVASFSEF
jgi:hypothetical protein